MVPSSPGGRSARVCGAASTVCHWPRTAGAGIVPHAAPTSLEGACRLGLGSCPRVAGPRCDGSWNPSPGESRFSKGTLRCVTVCRPQWLGTLSGGSKGTNDSHRLCTGPPKVAVGCWTGAGRCGLLDRGRYPFGLEQVMGAAPLPRVGAHVRCCESAPSGGQQGPFRRGKSSDAALDVPLTAWDA